MGMMTNLLGTLPSATFKKDPDQSLILSMVVPLDTTWSIGEDDDLLSITVGATSAEIDLTALTMQGLKESLSSIGLSGGTVAWEEGSASLLTPGQSGTVPAGGNLFLYAFTSPLWAILRPYDRELRTAQTSSEDHKNQLILTQSEQFWVDFWGSYFGVARRSSEADAPYIERIIAEVFRARNTKIAIESGIFDSLGWDVHIKEPWRAIFTLGRSRLSGYHHFQGDYYRYHIIHPLSAENVDWELVEEQVHRLRPAGTLMWTPENWATPSVLDAQLPTDLIVNEPYGLYQEWMDLASGRLSRSLTLSRDYYFLRVLHNQTWTYHPGMMVSVFYSDTGEPSWDIGTWTSYGATTWREKSSVGSPILVKVSSISDDSSLEQIHTLAGTTLTQAHLITPEDLTHLHTLAGTTLTEEPFLITPEDLTHLHTLAGTTLSLGESPLAAFDAVYALAGVQFWRSIGYFPEALADSGAIDQEELHAAMLMFT